MTVTRPYRRTFRQHVNGSYTEGGKGRYVRHPKYGDAPKQYVRAYLLIQKDLQELFDYIEPADENLMTYSYRTHELLIRTCVEVEANCKAILLENGYAKAGDWRMPDYRLLNTTHRLSSYKIRVPHWHGIQHTCAPFGAWDRADSLNWYSAYNAVKHDRHNEFAKANFANLLNAVSGLVALLAAQFGSEDFSPSSNIVITEDDYREGFEDSIGGFFQVRYPDDWPADQRYEFNWQNLENEPDPFQSLSF
ncbi:MAG: hypothetical protein ABMA14_17815 [Hyphomonadaceae bacterium]